MNPRLAFAALLSALYTIRVSQETMTLYPSGM
jgi:hypothetical protein